MPAFEIESRDQQRKAIEVLMKVGGTFQGVGNEKRFMLVTNAQYRALVKAGVVKPDVKKGRARGKQADGNGKV